MTHNSFRLKSAFPDQPLKIKHFPFMSFQRTPPQARHPRTQLCLNLQRRNTAKRQTRPVPSLAAAQHPHQISMQNSHVNLQGTVTASEDSILRSRGAYHAKIHINNKGFDREVLKRTSVALEDPSISQDVHSALETRSKS